MVTREDGPIRRIWVAEIDDDTEGQGGRVKFVGQTEDDVEGQIKCQGRFVGQTEDGKHLVEIDVDEDVAGQALRFTELDRTDDTQGGPVTISFIRPADEDDAEGQGRVSIRGSGQTDEDVQGQIYIKHRPVD